VFPYDPPVYSVVLFWLATLNRSVLPGSSFLHPASSFSQFECLVVTLFSAVILAFQNNGEEHSGPLSLLPPPPNVLLFVVIFSHARYVSPPFSCFHLIYSPFLFPPPSSDSGAFTVSPQDFSYHTTSHRRSVRAARAPHSPLPLFPVFLRLCSEGCVFQKLFGPLPTLSPVAVSGFPWPPLAT